MTDRIKTEDVEIKDLVPVRPQLNIESTHIKFNGVGVDFVGVPPREEWFQAFQAFQGMENMVQFCLGDMIVFADYTWGEKYEDVIAHTDYDYGTLRHFASVARRFPEAFRKKICVAGDTNANKQFAVSFSSFQEVAPLSDEVATHFLEMVRDGGWSREKLREEIQRYKNNGKLPEPKERAAEYIPEGYAPFSHLSKDDRYYIPAPEIVGRPVREGEEDRYRIELFEWEIERLRGDYEDDPTMVSLVNRLEIALGEE